MSKTTESLTTLVARPEILNYTKQALFDLDVYAWLDSILAEVEDKVKETLLSDLFKRKISYNRRSNNFEIPVRLRFNIPENADDIEVEQWIEMFIYFTSDDLDYVISDACIGWEYDWYLYVPEDELFLKVDENIILNKITTKLAKMVSNYIVENRIKRIDEQVVYNICLDLLDKLTPDAEELIYEHTSFDTDTANALNKVKEIINSLESEPIKVELEDSEEEDASNADAAMPAAA